MDAKQINDRVDGALEANRRAEAIVVRMAIAIFAAGTAGFFLGYWSQNPYIGTGSVILEGFLYWPIREILKLRRDNIILQVLPVMLAELPPDEAAKQLVGLIESLRDKK